MAIQSLCSIPDCGKRPIGRGWCSLHYERWRKYGDPLMVATAKGEAQRYLREVVMTYEGDDCLPWPYSTNISGYGIINIDGRTTVVTRQVCEHVHGPAPSTAHQAAHSCGNGHLRCCTKRHVSWKTPAGNAADRLIHGTHQLGSQNHRAKLTAEKVRKIRQMATTKGPRQIARELGIHRETVRVVVNRQSWGWLD